MKVQEIITLIDFISKKRLDEVKLETSNLKLSIKKKTSPKIIEQQLVATPLAASMVAAPVQVVAPTTPIKETPVTVKEEDNSKYVTVKSPMIGTFYRSSNPETPSFAEVGASITKGQTVCIIEAMKLFNEIESEVSGTIVKVLVEDATPVEFDQALFLVDPS